MSPDRFWHLLQCGKRARLVNFEGNSVEVVSKVKLSRKNREIQHYWDETGHLLPNNPEGNLWIDIDSGRKTHKKWVTNVRDVNDAKTSYHVVVDRADHDDDQELPQRTLPLTKEGEERMKPEWTVEPKVIFRLVSPVVKKPPCVRGTAQEYFEPCLPGEAPIFSYPDSCFASQTLLPPEPKVAIAPLPEVQTCPRPRSPTPPPPPPPPKRASPEYVRPPRRLSTVSPSPPRRMTPTPSLPPRRTSKIKFSTSTALYTPAKPVYEAHKRRESSNKLANEQSYSAMTMKPYEPPQRSQSGPKSRISLYTPAESHRRRMSGPGLPINRLPGSYKGY